MGEENIIAHATEYYKNLFGPAPGNIFSTKQSLWETNEVVNSQDNEDLCKPFTEVEINDALLEMETNKAAGPDAIPIEFYQSCWNIVKAKWQ